MKTEKQFSIGSLRTSAIALIFVMSVGLFSWAKTTTPQAPSLEDQIHHIIVMDPFYTVFDNIEYSVDHGTVTLQGQVIRPVLKSDIAKSVANLPDVKKVVDHIQVLPISGFDDSIRLAEYRMLYSPNGTLSRYSWGPVPSIHIIVDHGNVTLTGVVDNQTDKNMATLRAGLVPNVFSVKNDLIVK
jgi:hyperosmotically inducible protein